MDLKTAVVGLFALWVGACAGQEVFRKGDRVAWIGDSITSCAHRLPHGYITTIEKAAKETGTSGFDNIIGLGYGGWHVYSWHAYERRSLKEPALDSRFPRVPTLGDVFTNRLDVIVLALGINDHGFPTFADNDLSPWEAEYDRFICDLRERCHPRQFILCNTTTHTADPGASANLRLARMNERIAALAKRHGALLVDFRTPAWRAIERVRRMKTGLRDLKDLIHPNEIGHVEMALDFCRTVGEPEMVQWLEGERSRRYAALEAKLGGTPRLVCSLQPDRTENSPGVQRLAYDIPWNLVGAETASVSVALPSGWRVSEKTLSPSNGVFRVFGHPAHLVNPVVVTARLKDRVLTETVPIPAPWLVSGDFAFPDAWQGAAWQTNAAPPVALADVKKWSLHTPTWDFAGDTDPGALDLRATNTGYPKGAAYVRRRLYAPEAMNLRLVLGTTFWSARNGVRIWCDGKLLGETLLASGWNKDGKPFACADREFPLELTPGWHDLVLLTANREFDHYFHCKILDVVTGAVPENLRVACTPHPAEVRRVVLPDQLERGNTSIVPLSPIDRAAWIAPRDAALPKGGLFLKFRKNFEADGVTPLRFHVSADERFVLLLDGEVIARGPDRGAPDMWFFQTYETVPTKGRHVFDAVVWKMVSKQPPLAQLSWRLGFVFAAEGAYEAQLTTGKARWRVAKLERTAMTRHFYQGGCGAECVVCGRDILSEEPEEKAWEAPVVVRPPIVANPSRSSRRPGWLVYPSQLPAQIAREVRPGRCVAVDDQAFVTNGVYFRERDVWGSNAVFRAESAADPRRTKFDALLRGGGPLEIPAHASVRFLWNLGDYYCAYPVMKTRGGKGAAVGWSWAEALFVGDCFDWHTVVTDKVRKGLGNRNDFIGKYFYGKEDLFFPEGAEGEFTVPWWNCGVWCLVEVKTGDAPLTIDKVALVETRYPLEPEAYFRCDDESLEDVQRICLRGLQMCMHEMHFDCPYYEQQMYGGDTRLQMMMCQALSPDDALNRQAFRLFEVSQRDNGMISMNYPTTWLQESTSFSQYWGMMLGDYAMWRNNPGWVRARMPAVRRMLFGLERHLDADGFQSDTPGWHFVDWVPDWPAGTAPGHDENRSAIDNLLYLLTLRKAALVEMSLGETELTTRWTRRADALAKSILARFWCERRGLIADTPDKDRFSEHAQALAILADVLTPDRKSRVAEGLASADDLARCTASFSSYLFEAYFKLGRADLFLKKLDTWRDYVKMGLHTPLEGPGDSRSDCHAWSANPIYHFHSGIAGVNPAEPGFKSIRIAPQPGSLKWLKSKTATPKGYVVQDLRFDGEKVFGKVILPRGLYGEFVWHGAPRRISEGVNQVNE